MSRPKRKNTDRSRYDPKDEFMAFMLNRQRSILRSGAEIPPGLVKYINTKYKENIRLLATRWAIADKSDPFAFARVIANFASGVATNPERDFQVDFARRREINIFGEPEDVVRPINMKRP